VYPTTSVFFYVQDSISCLPALAYLAFFPLMTVYDVSIFLAFIIVISYIAHEYVKVDGNVGTVGITDFAQAALGDIVFVDLPEVGDEFEKGDSFGSVESVKAASDVYAPVSGTVTEINDKLGDEPALVNAEAEGEAWFIKLDLKDTAELGDLLGPDAYKEHCEKEAH